MNLAIEGSLAPYLEVDLGPGESLVAESGSLLAKEPSVVMKSALFGGVASALKRALSGSSLFLVEYQGPGHLTLSKGEPGRLREIVLAGESVLVTSGSFLCAERSVSLGAGVASDAAGIFWAQLPLLMLRLSGEGRAFGLARGDAKEVHLGRGESLEVAPGRIAWLTSGVRVERASSPSIKDALFGGVGLSLVRLTGPGRVCLQTRDVASERRRDGVVVRVGKEPHRGAPDERVREGWIWDGHRRD